MTIKFEPDEIMDIIRRYHNVPTGQDPPDRKDWSLTFIAQNRIVFNAPVDSDYGKPYIQDPIEGSPPNQT